jgi:hypothetical protein
MEMVWMPFIGVVFASVSTAMASAFLSTPVGNTHIGTNESVASRSNDAENVLVIGGSLAYGYRDPDNNKQQLHILVTIRSGYY